MPKIEKLSEQIANQIAAGEVVERPVAVVKELVENSIDAGATEIEIQFRKGGKSLIEVRDNGCGMLREDALLSLERHATSKIRSAADLNHVRSFGFRGEAVPSIASVSQFTMQTRPSDQEAGTQILVDAGHIGGVSECAMPAGTRISVARLFHPVPARRKFLKTDRTEAAHIVQLCRLLAVAHPEISFALIEDGRTLFRSPACPNLKERVGEIFGRQLPSQLLELDACSLKGRKIEGLISCPGFGRSTRADMNFFVNRRPVDSRLLFYAVVESFHTYLPRGRYPVTFLFLEIDPEEIDVNVHPAKREIRFRDETGVRQFVMEEVLRALRASARAALPNARPVDAMPASSRAEPSSAAPIAEDADDADEETIPNDGESVSAGAQDEEDEEDEDLIPVRAVPQPERRPEPARGPVRSALSPVPSPRRQPESARLEPAPIHKPAEPVEATEALPWRFLGVHAGRYALFDGPDGVMTVHVAAARERICFERVLKRLEAREPASQILLFPLNLELDPVGASVLDAHRGFFGEVGFDIEDFGRHHYRVRAVPEWFSSEESEQLLEDLVSLIRERGLRPDGGSGTREAVAACAARRLARGQRLEGPTEALNLLRELFRCENPLTDARGRPVLTETRTGQLDRKFGVRES